jgi:ubiquinone biosynthesis protein
MLRMLHINRVLLRHGLDDIVLATHLFRPVRFIRFLFPWYWWRKDMPPRAERIRRALEDLGPIFVKFGQNLSTRRDLLPGDIADQLAMLQDQVPPFPGAEARAFVEKVYGEPVSQVFRSFDTEALASASIAQVHAAELNDGTQVVVKVLRPGIIKTIRHDLDLLYTLAQLADRYWKEARRLRPVEVVREYEKTILDELDLMREAANASQLRRNFQDSPLLYVPEVYWPWCRRDIMVMERISGIPVSNVAELRRQNVDLQQLSERGVEIFFTQVFRDNFFHADMHPGNIFVAPDGQYIAVDFGIMGTLSPTDQLYLAENFVAFFNRDYRRVAELHVQSEWVPSDTRVDEFEAAIRSVCEPIFERPLKDISFGHLLLRLFQTARRFNMEVQPQLVLLQKTLLNIEGLGRQLYPDLDLWKTAKPYLEQWMKEQVGPGAAFKEFKANWPAATSKLPQLPMMLHDVLRQAQEGKLAVQWESRELTRLRREMRSANQRIFVAIVGSALLICAGVILALDGYAPKMIGDAPALTWILGVLGAALLLAAWPSSSD